MAKLNAVIAAAFAALTCIPPAIAQQFPTRDLAGSIMWGPGGAMDVVSRAIAPMVEPMLGRSIVLTNRPGGTGAIATLYVNSRPPDGYNLLFGAENPQLYKVLGLCDLDYDSFYAVNVLVRGVAVVAVRADAPWHSLRELIEHARMRRGRVKMGTTGIGGVPHMIGALLQTLTKFEVTSVPFDGEGPGITALLGGHVDFIPVGIGAAAAHVKAGRIRALAVINNESVPALPDVPPVTDEFPEFAKYLPWGPFYGVFVRRDTPEPAKAALTTAFRKAAEMARFRDTMEARGYVMMNIFGDDADQFLRKWRSTTAWVLEDAGAAKQSPAKFGIRRP